VNRQFLGRAKNKPSLLSIFRADTSAADLVQEIHATKKSAICYFRENLLSFAPRLNKTRAAEWFRPGPNYFWTEQSADLGKTGVILN
jgi:hypothetical protein